MTTLNISNKLPIWIVFILYFSLNALLLLIVDPGLHLSEGADASTWYEPAQAILAYGSFVNYDAPDTIMTYRPPLYPLFEALLMWVGGNIVSIVIGQIILLWFTGVLVGKIIKSYLHRYEVIAISIFVFNPNALGSAQLIQSDILYAFFITSSVWSLVNYSLQDNKVKWSIITGVFLGLSCLTRPTGQYLIFMLPLIFVVVNALAFNSNMNYKSLSHGLICSVVSGVIVLPWMLHNQEAEWGFVLVTSEVKVNYLRDNVIYAEKKHNNLSIGDASVKIKNNESKYLKSHRDINNMTKKERSDFLVSYYKNQLITYPVTTLANSYVDSLIGFFGGGGATNFHNILSLDGERAIVKNINNYYSGRMELAWSAFSDYPLSASIITGISYLYVILLRVLGVIGVVEMIKKKDYSLLFIVIGVIVYFSITVIFVGTSRYRLPIESSMIILSIYGFLFFRPHKK